MAAIPRHRLLLGVDVDPRVGSTEKLRGAEDGCDGYVAAMDGQQCGGAKQRVRWDADDNRDDDSGLKRAKHETSWKPHVIAPRR